MTISIIGSGAIGSVLARRFAATGLDVAIANKRGAASLADMAFQLGPHVRPVDIAEALGADTIILAVMYTTVRPFPDRGAARLRSPHRRCDCAYRPLVSWATR